MNSTLYLLNNVDLDPDYNYTIDFNTLAQQSTYFDSKVAEVLEQNTGYSYLRANKVIKVQVNIDDLEGVNYLYYINKNKRYYAFITNKEYISQTCTALNFKIDVMQTFMFDYTIEESFVNREHQNRFKERDNTLEVVFNLNTENIDIGNNYNLARKYEAKQSKGYNESQVIDSNNRIYWLTITATEPLETKTYATEITKEFTQIKGLPTNLYTYVMPIRTLNNINWSTYKTLYLANKQGVTNYNELEGIGNAGYLNILAKNEKIINITYSSYCPLGYQVEQATINGNTEYVLYLTKYESGTGSTLQNFRTALVTVPIEGYSTTMAMFRLLDITGNTAQAISIDRPLGVNLYNISKSILDPTKPKNILNEPKMLISPYRFYLCNYGVSECKYSEQEFYKYSNWLSFYYYPTFGSRNGCVIVPMQHNRKYKFNISDNHTDQTKSIRIDGSTQEFPLLTDVWKTYYNTHKASISSGLVTSAIQTGASIGLGLATGGMGLAVAGTQALNFGASIANQIASYKDIQSQPDKIRNNTTDNLQELVLNNNYMTICEYELPDSILNRVFEYFYHYGYNCNDFKQPNIRSRYYFNYIKTIGANIKTNIDAEHKTAIRNIFDNGITIWHYRDSATFKGVNNYKFENPEIDLMEATNND